MCLSAGLNKSRSRSAEMSSKYVGRTEEGAAREERNSIDGNSEYLEIDYNPSGITDCLVVRSMLPSDLLLLLDTHSSLSQSPPNNLLVTLVESLANGRIGLLARLCFAALPPSRLSLVTSSLPSTAISLLPDPFNVDTCALIRPDFSLSAKEALMLASLPALTQDPRSKTSETPGSNTGSQPIVSMPLESNFTLAPLLQMAAPQRKALGRLLSIYSYFCAYLAPENNKDAILRLESHPILSRPFRLDSTSPLNLVLEYIRLNCHARVPTHLPIVLTIPLSPEQLSDIAKSLSVSLYSLFDFEDYPSLVCVPFILPW